jgi:hypothetical protein
MTDVKATTQKGKAIIWDYDHANHQTIWDAYNRPSSTKVSTYLDIKDRAEATEGYNYDLSVAGAGSNFYSTVYSYTENGALNIIKDTYANTYRVVLELAGKSIAEAIEAALS